MAFISHDIYKIILRAKIVPLEDKGVQFFLFMAEFLVYWNYQAYWRKYEKVSDYYCGNDADLE